MTPTDAGIALVRAFGKGARFEVYYPNTVCLVVDGRNRGRVTLRMEGVEAHAIAAALSACHAEGLAAIEGEGIAAIDGAVRR